MRYPIVIEDAGTNLAAFFPDLPGCVTTGKDIDEIKINAKEALELHLWGMRRDGDDVPAPGSVELASAVEELEVLAVDYIEVE